MIFQNREQAAEGLVAELTSEEFDMVIGITRGGLILADFLGRVFKRPWGGIVVKKIGHPAFPELALGAVASNGEAWVDWDLVLSSGIDEEELKAIWKRKEEEAQNDSSAYEIPKYRLLGKRILLVDDGAATAATALAAVRALRKMFVRSIIYVAPVCSNEAFKRLEKEVRVICLDIPIEFWSVGQFYKEFSEVTKSEIIKLVKEGQKKL